MGGALEKEGRSRQALAGDSRDLRVGFPASLAGDLSWQALRASVDARGRCSGETARLSKAESPGQEVPGTARTPCLAFPFQRCAAPAPGHHVDLKPTGRRGSAPLLQLAQGPSTRFQWNRRLPESELVIGPSAVSFRAACDISLVWHPAS